MERTLRLLQRITTGVLLFPSAALLIFAYLSATRPNHTAAEAAVLLVLGLALLPLNWIAWNWVVRIRMARQPGADPTTPAARLSRSPYLAIVPVLLGLGLLRLANGVNARVRDDGALESMRRACVESAVKTATVSAINPSSAEVKARIDRYCGCVVTGVKTQYSAAELAQLDGLSAGELEGERRFNRLLETCASSVAPR
ncbi:MAG: hypothetical protein ACXWLP_03230 [Myxococcaceae bacterium]